MGDNMDSDAPKLEGIVDLSIEGGVENEKCVVAQYRTTAKQKQAFENLLTNCPRNNIPIEWVIDIADESNGWFYGTAYHFDDTTQMLHVMVPDKLNPSFNGHVMVDYRTVHLIECVDGQSDALFNKIVRDSIVKVKWEVEWFEEENVGENGEVVAEDAANGRWVLSSARYYIRMANQLLVEDENFGQDSKGFVMLTADLNVKLRNCYKGRGQEDFNRLVTDRITQFTPEAAELVKQTESQILPGRGSSSGYNSMGGGKRGEEMGAPSIKRLADITRGLRESIAELLDERDKLSEAKYRMAEAFTAFTLDGDLDAGMEVMIEMENAIQKEQHKKAQSKRGKDGKVSGNGEGMDPSDAVAEDTWFLVQKVEKGLEKLIVSGVGSSSSATSGEGTPASPNTSTNANNNAELESLRRMQKRMKKELEEKERELESYRSAPSIASVNSGHGGRNYDVL